MTRKKKRSKVHRYYRKKRQRKPGLKTYLGSKLVELSIILLVVLLVVFVFSLYQRLSQSEAKEDEDLVLARIQILNGCNKEGVSQKLAERLRRMQVGNIVYQITEIEKLDDSVPEESLILDRLGERKSDKPSQVAILTAEALGIRKANVIYKSLNDNYQGIWLTIVIGKDGELLLTSG
jgi:hypothetical protein